MRRPLAIRLAASALAGLACGFVYVSGLPEALHVGALAKAERVGLALGLEVAEITVTGRARAEEAAVLAALGIAVGDPLLDLEVDAARRRLLAVPWVGDARVMRVLPSHVHVEIVERAPVYIWQHQGRFLALDAAGAAIAPIASAGSKGLFHIVGKGAPEAAPQLTEHLSSAAEVAEAVRAAVRVGDRRWDLHFDNHVVVQLPDSEVQEALADLSDMIVRDRLLDRAVRIVDLRDRQHPRLTLRDGAAARMFIAGDDT